MRVFKAIIYTILILTISYISLGYTLTFFPKKSNIDDELKDKILYIYYDKMHSDIIINLKETNRDWRGLFPQLLERSEGYLEFGWGDRDTYLSTPEWRDLKLSIALKALFLNSESVVHVIHYRDIDEFKNIKKIRVSKTQYRDIENRLLESFGERPKFVSNGYWGVDAFYSSVDSYNLFNTCNCWTGDILRDSNVTMSYWTPLSFMVISSLNR
jgi:uncharacterized protein (TIGR02117 family)